MKLKPSLKHCLTPFLFCIAPLPFVYSLFALFSHIERVHEAEDRLETLHRKALNIRLQKEKESSFLKQMGEADPSYVDTHLNSLLFLEPEIKKWKAIATDGQGASRLDFLESGNQFQLSDETIRSSGTLEEIEHKLQHPVEINTHDLKKTLSLIEGVAIPPFTPQEGAPQFIIKQFDLSKKSVSSQEKVFVLNLQLIERKGISK
jgi:hypothetical protein